MATNQLLQVYGDQIVFADVTDFPSSGAGPPITANNSLIRGTAQQLIQLDLTGVTAAAFRQSTKSVTLAITDAAWGIEYRVKACTEHETAPAAGGTVDFWWSTSQSATAAVGNSGGASGADSAYTAAGEGQMIYIGSLDLRNTVINIGEVGIFTPLDLFGSLIVQNNGSTAFRSTATAMDETHIIMEPLIPDLQAAA